MHTCLWNEPNQGPERVAFANFEWRQIFFLNLKTHGGEGPKNFVVELLK